MRFFSITFSADNEAVNVKWEIIDDDQEIEIHKPTEKDPLGTENPLFSMMIFL